MFQTIKTIQWWAEFLARVQIENVKLFMEWKQ